MTGTGVVFAADGLGWLALGLGDGVSAVGGGELGLALLGVAGGGVIELDS